MDEVRALSQSALQTSQVGRIQDTQQRQATIDQRAGVQNFSQRAVDKRSQVSGPAQVESDALSADGHSDGGRGEQETPEPGAERQDAAVKDPDLGGTIDLRA